MVANAPTLYTHKRVTISDLEQRILTAIGGAERVIRTAVINAITVAKMSFGELNNLVRLLEAGRFDDAIDVAARAGAIRVSDSYAAVYVAAGVEASTFVERALDITIGFDQVNVRAVQHMQNERLRLIREFTNEQRLATRTALVDGIQRGLNPRQQARNFRQSIGLTQRQVAAVQNYRRLLEGTSDGDTSALTRQLRDRRFDGTVRRAARQREPLTALQIDRMVERYGDRYVKYRAEVIARTEALRAVHAGSDEAFRQAIDVGSIAATEVERTWVTAADERVRSSHAALGGLVRRIDETYPGFNGALRYPGDPLAPGSETIQCRCVLSTRLVIVP